LEACNSVLSNSGCGACSDGYVLSGFVCIRSGLPPLPGCAVMTPMQTCQYCMDGFQLDPTGNCIQAAGGSGTITTVVSSTTIVSTGPNNPPNGFGGPGIGGPQNGFPPNGQPSNNNPLLILSGGPSGPNDGGFTGGGDNNGNNWGNGGNGESTIGPQTPNPPNPRTIQVTQTNVTSVTVVNGDGNSGQSSSKCSMTDENSGKCLRC